MYELDVSGLKQNLEAFQAQTLTVGILDRGLMSKKADYRKHRQLMMIGNIRNAGDSVDVKGRMVRRPIRTGKAGHSDLTLKGLSAILDSKRGLFKLALTFASNKQLEELIRMFAIENKTSRQLKMLENAGRSIVRNSIMRKDYGANKQKVIKQKGFNRWGVATGTLLKNIQAIYRPKKR